MYVFGYVPLFIEQKDGVQDKILKMTLSAFDKNNLSRTTTGNKMHRYTYVRNISLL